MIELSLVFLGFFMLCVGVAEFSMAMYAYNFCFAEAQEAARWASTQGSHSGTPATEDDVRTFVKSKNVGLDPSKIVVSANWEPNHDPGSTVTVTVKYTVVPLAGLAIRSNFDVSSTAGRPINN